MEKNLADPVPESDSAHIWRVIYACGDAMLCKNMWLVDVGKLI